MTDVKATNFVQRICEKTLKGELSWEQTSDVGEFQATVANYVIRFTPGPGRELYTLILMDMDGGIVDTFNDEMFDEPGTAHDPESMFLKMREAYHRARSMAMGVDKALDDVLAALDE
jgi:hypothetical protein